MGNLFASFNPNTSLIWGLPINWLAFFRVFLVIPQGYWLIKSKCLLIFNSICHYLLSEMKAILGGLMVPGHTLWLIGLFWLVLCSNFLGLVPYVFTPSRHLRYSVSLSLPIWLGYIIYRVVIQFEENMAHLVPEGTPGALLRVIVLIESVRLLIRPWTLAIRLAANIVAGHLLLTLLGGQGVNCGGVVLLCLMGALIALLGLEVGVASIQAYVFVVLRSLYIGEHSSKKLNLIKS